MRLEIFLVLAAAFVAQGLEDHTNLDFFMALGEMEDALRNKIFNFEECYSRVKERHETVIKNFLKSMNEITSEVTKILKSNTLSMNYGNHATRLLVQLGERMMAYPKNVINFVCEDKYKEAADLVFTQRKDIERENSLFDSWMDKIKRKHSDLVQKVYKLLDKIRDETIQEGRKVAIDYAICIEGTRCSPNAGYQIIQ